MIPFPLATLLGLNIRQQLSLDTICRSYERMKSECTKEKEKVDFLRNGFIFHVLQCKNAVAVEKYAQKIKSAGSLDLGYLGSRFITHSGSNMQTVAKSILGERKVEELDFMIKAFNEYKENLNSKSQSFLLISEAVSKLEFIKSSQAKYSPGW